MKPQYDVKPMLKPMLAPMFYDCFEEAVLLNLHKCNVCVFICGYAKDTWSYLPIIKNYDEEKLMKCGACKTISYCSREHQTLHWRLHKDLCLATRSLLKKYSLKHLHEMYKLPQFADHEAKVMKEFCLTIGRTLTMNEFLHLLYARGCFSCKNKSSNDNHKFVACKTCKMMTYCNETCPSNDAAKHEQICDAIRAAFKFYWIHENLDLTFANKWANSGIYKTKNLIEYLRNFSFNQKFNAKLSENTQEQFKWLNSASCMSSVVTVLYSLNKCNFDADSADHLNMWVLTGAIGKAMKDFNLFKLKFFSSQFQNLKRITLIVIDYKGNGMNSDKCEVVRVLGRHVLIRVIAMGIDIRSTETMPIVDVTLLTFKPNLIFFDTVGEEFSISESKYLRHLCDAETIFVFSTGLIENSKYNLEVFKSMFKVHTMVENYGNPFKALSPTLSVQPYAYYQNGFLNILKFLD